MDPTTFDPATLAHLRLLAASLFGGLVRLIFRPASSIRQYICLLIGSMACGVYATPPVMIYFAFPADSRDAVCALLSFVGLSLAGRILKFVDNLDVGAIVLKWFEKKSG